MSKSLSSPTARMLRSSRLFSMPPPLPQPPVEVVMNNGLIRTSDTATHPYPTRQAITAPASSRNRGDWGLKRPLPDKTNLTSTPHVRINALDTLEHITDFDSASDHTRTLAKWQELRIPMVQEKKSARDETSARSMGPSAFNEMHDNTATPKFRSSDGSRLEPVDLLPRSAERALRLRALSRHAEARRRTRWKTDGPWLPSMSQTEFDLYVDRVVKNPATRAEFGKFLLALKRQEKREAAMQNVIDKRDKYDPQSAIDVEEVEVASRIEDPKKELDDFIQQLRGGVDQQTSQLSRLIEVFFDLPASTDLDGDPVAPRHAEMKSQMSSLTGPPPTHPSAGLSYTRSSAYMENHAVHGPQFFPSPVRARVLRPRESLQGTTNKALIGVAGIVTEDTYRSKGFQGSTETNESQSYAFNFDRPGGNKLWVEPSRAHIDQRGRISLTVFDADKEAVAVHTGRPDPRPRRREEDPASLTARLKDTSVAPGTGSQNDAPRGTAANANYGSALPDTKTLQRAQGLGRDEMKQFMQKVKDKNGDRLGEGLIDLLAEKDRKA